MLAIAVAATVLCFVWIALDSGTGDVFDVYGRMTRIAWQMELWSLFVSCGWRLAIIAGVVLLNVSFAYQAIIANATDAEIAKVVMWCLAVLMAFGLVPWTFLMRALRQRRWINAHAIVLSETAARLRTMPDLSTELERAQYTTEAGWDAWHPNSGFYETAEGQKLWSDVVPVVYTSKEFPRTVVIPIDFSTFYVWGDARGLAHAGRLLPFGGPGTSRFRASSYVRRLDAAGDCWILPAECELPDEADEIGA